MVAIAIRHKVAAPLVILACIGGSALLVNHIPAQLAPQEDRGVIFAFIKGAEGTSYNRMTANMDIVQDRLMPLLGQGVLKSFSVQAPAFGGRAGDQTGFVIMQLEDWEDRNINADQALVMIAQVLKDIPM